MQIDLSQGSFADIAALNPALAPTVEAVRALVIALHPDVSEMARVGERSVCWGWGCGKMSESYAYAIPYSRHVNVGFFHGITLPDPDRRLTGTGKALRHVRLTGPADVDAPSIRALLIAAREERRRALNP